MKNTVTMAELMKQVEAFEKPQNLDEGFASDAQRQAAFAQGYKAKGKKDKKDEEVLDEAKATLSRFGGDRLKSSIMNLAKQRGLKVKDLGKDKIEISGNGKVVMAITLAVQKKDVKINEEAELDESLLPLFFALYGVGAMVVLPGLMVYDIVNRSNKRGDYLDAKVGKIVGNMVSKFKKDKNYKPTSAEVDAAKKLEKEVKSKEPSIFKKAMEKLKLIKSKSEEVDIQEDGHTDVASAIRQCKTMVEDAMQITSKLQTMNPEDSLPSWWTNKLAVSSNSMNKLRDYFLVPTTEEVELEEKAGDIPDLKNLVGELVKASGMHLAQSKRVQAHVDMMTKANAKGPEGAGGLADLKKIVGELEKASEAHKRQSKSIDAHVKFMGESIEDELDEAMKYTHVAVDSKGKLIGLSTKESDAVDMARRNKGKALKLMKPISQKKGDMMVNRTLGGVMGDAQIVRNFMEEVELEEKVYFSKKTKDGNIFQVVDRNTKGMKGSQDKFQMQIVSKGGKMVKDIGSHPSVDGAKQYAKSKGILEEVELDENASRAFDDLIKTGGIDKKDFQKAKQLYMKKDLMGLRKFIYNLDTDPLESIMDIISTNDSKAFMKMYPKSKKGEYMSSIAHTHKEAVDLVSTATEILTTANTYEEK